MPQELFQRFGRKYIHNTNFRMPVILHPEDEQQWLDPELSEEDIATLMRPYPDKGMAGRTISPYFYVKRLMPPLSSFNHFPGNRIQGLVHWQFMFFQCRGNLPAHFVAGTVPGVNMDIVLGHVEGAISHHAKE